MTDEQGQASWKNRRRMAWLAFFGLMLMVAGMLYHILFKGGDPASWTGIMSTIIMTLGAIVIVLALRRTVHEGPLSSTDSQILLH